MIEADPHDQGGAPQVRELRRLDLDGMRVLLRRGQALDFDASAADGFHERLEVAGCCDDLDFLLWKNQPRHREEQCQDKTANQDFLRLVKIDFGIMQCTPLRMSTICETRQSPAIDTRP